MADALSGSAARAASDRYQQGGHGDGRDRPADAQDDAGLPLGPGPADALAAAIKPTLTSPA
jgi:hypothetical protein